MNCKQGNNASDKVLRKNENKEQIQAINKFGTTYKHTQLIIVLIKKSNSVL